MSNKFKHFKKRRGMNEHFQCINNLNKSNDLDTTRDLIHSYIKNNFVLGAEEVLDDNESLLEAGIIDSTSVLELVEFIELTFKFKINDKDLDHENFDTINLISQFITARLTQPPSA
jgi:acyl carrier protein